ncbi:hypothetical protein TZ01_03250 [Acidiplasma sp. MBA-1]|uniref:Uncharacterized protein n=2 Tax=Ferroplasmaceae TaxID=90142 RepID=A0A0Q0XHK8_9ARCH|nr:hypothetical protein TZ01_03250 [Acidiplasma sp. MBA-1]KQB34102.1 hypothetical protein AOG55_01415 [Acidiplasma cupricumulans]
MLCIGISNKKIVGYPNIMNLLKSGVESLFLIDFDAIHKRVLNLEIYEKLSKFFDLTVMNYPQTEEDLMDTIISGATYVIINNNLTYKRIQSYLSYTQNIGINYDYNDTCVFFSQNGGNIYLTNKQVMLPYRLAFNYGPFDLPNSIKLENYPSSFI